MPNSNGITISDNDEYLCLASDTVICTIEVVSKIVLNALIEAHLSRTV
jgi:hypothetical protein